MKKMAWVSMVLALFVLGGCATTGGAMGDGSYDATATTSVSDDWVAQQQAQAAQQQAQAMQDLVNQENAQAAQDIANNTIMQAQQQVQQDQLNAMQGQ